MKKGNRIWIYPLILMGALLIAISSCKKDSSTNTVTDVDGNVYHTVTIGTQTWLVENLRTTKYTDGTAIPKVTDATAWGNLKTGARCYYNNDSATYAGMYGVLYNWYAVNTLKLAPAGWHVPDEAEWQTLITYLGGISAAGGKLKESGTTHWNNPNTGATNETGFTALPSGYRNYDGKTYLGINIYCDWWSSSAESDSHSYRWGLNYSDINVYRYDYVQLKAYGFSVRCIKN